MENAQSNLEKMLVAGRELLKPITAIRDNVGVLLLETHGATNEKQEKVLDEIKSNTEVLNILVNDLIDESRFEVVKVTLYMQMIDLQEITEKAIKKILGRSKGENKPMDVSIKASHDLPKAYGDPERVQQILAQLINNAYCYTPENGTISVTIGITDDEHQLQVDIKDNGVGIPREDQEHIFERFFRGESPIVLATPGTGLGLPIAQRLVELLSGRIWFESSGVPGEGSRFSFTLPIYESSYIHE